MFVHAYWPGDTLGANSEIFASLPLALSVLAFLQAQKKPAWSLMFLSGALVGVATLIRQPSAVNLGVTAGVSRLWLAHCLALSRFERVLAAGSGVVIGFIAVIAALAWYYQLQGNLHDAYLWAWAFAIRYVESETTFGYVLKRLVTVHLAVILLSGLLWYFGIWQVVETLRSFWRRKPVSSEAILLILWFGLTYLAIFIGWRFSDIIIWQCFRRCRFSRARRSRALSRTATFSSATLAMDPNRHHRCGRAASDGFSHRGLCSCRTQTLIFFSRLFSRSSRGRDPNDRIFVWGSSPRLYSFSGRRMATRFVSCSHLVGAYASRPREVRDRGESVIPGSWEMFQADWEAHPPAAHHRHVNGEPVLVGCIP